VSGLADGESIALQNNGADTVTVSANGAFSFPTPVGGNGTYSITVSTQPEGQVCTVSGGTGSGVTGDIAQRDRRLLDGHFHHIRESFRLGRRSASRTQEQRGR